MNLLNVLICDVVRLYQQQQQVVEHCIRKVDMVEKL